MAEIKYEIIEQLGVLSEKGSWRLEVNLIRWNDGEPKIDIRKWNTEKEGQMSKGISLSAAEWQALEGILGTVTI